MFRLSASYMFLACILVFSSCQNGDENKDSNVGDITEYTQDNSSGSDVLQFDGELFSIPSPIQSAIFLKENGTGFREDLLLAANDLDMYQTGSQKAIALGLYGAQLGYVSLYEENDKALNYMNTARKLADDIGLTGAFNETLVKRFSDNLGKPDSMVVLVSDIYESADVYLKGNERNDIAALVLFGGWMESLYVTCKESENGNEALRGRIAEQKSGYNRLVKMVNKYSENQAVVELQPTLNALSDAYAKVESKYVYQRPEVLLGEQKTILKGEVIHTIEESTLNEIRAAATAVRNQIIGMK